MAHDQHTLDEASGMHTTGHEWDGIKELNTPLPRWWLYTFYATIIFSIGYWIVYPSWPLIGGYTEGILGWHSRAAVVTNLKALQARRAPMEEKILKASLKQIEDTPELLAFARAAGHAAFEENCAPCHGAGAQGSYGYPNLNTNRWIWGGTLEEIHTTIEHGARWTKDPKTHMMMMPAFGRDHILTPQQISTVADYVRTLSGNKPSPGANLAQGAKIFADNCSACHGPKGKGNIQIGAPNLTTKIWLYGPTKADIMHRVQVGGGQVMPAWHGRLSEATIKALTVFVHSLGGGQ